MDSTDTPTQTPVPDGYKVLSEGKANILYHVKSDSDISKEAETETKPTKKQNKAQKMTKEAKDSTREAVFYNPVQEFNRDLSIL